MITRSVFLLRRCAQCQKNIRQKPSFAHRPLWHVFARHTWFMDLRLPALASRAAARAQEAADKEESL